MGKLFEKLRIEQGSLTSPERHRLFRRVAIAIFLVGLIWLLGQAYRVGVLPRYDSEQRYAAAVLGNDGRHIYYLERRTTGLSWGPGVANLSPRALKVSLGQTFGLLRGSLVDGSIELLREWSVPKASGHPGLAYRGQLFGEPEGHLEWRDGVIHYSFARQGDDSDSGLLWFGGTLEPEMLVALDQQLWTEEVPKINDASTGVSAGLKVLVYDHRGILLIDDARSLRRLFLFAEDAEAPSAATLATLTLRSLAN